MKLYTYFRSSASFRVRIALEIKEIECEYEYINLLKGENYSNSDYKKINPQQYVPSLLLDNGNVITESLAIIEYLDETFKEPQRLLPEDYFEKAYVRSLSQIIACDVHPLNNRAVLLYLENEFQANSEQTKKWYHNWLKRGFDAFESILDKHKLYGDFCLANQPTIADICLIPQIYNAKRFEFCMDEYPIINAIEKNCYNLKAFENAAPHNQGDA